MTAVSTTFFSCDRENDITGNPVVDPNEEVDGKRMYWIDFQLSNAGSLSQAAQDRFVELRDTVIYGDKGIKIIEHPMYVTKDYALTNFNKVVSLPNSESDLVQKIMKPTSEFGVAAGSVVGRCSVGSGSVAAGPCCLGSDSAGFAGSDSGYWDCQV